LGGGGDSRRHIAMMFGMERLGYNVECRFADMQMFERVKCLC